VAHCIATGWACLSVVLALSVCSEGYVTGDHCLPILSSTRPLAHNVIALHDLFCSRLVALALEGFASL
jgi:hypothetical protein